MNHEEQLLDATEREAMAQIVAPAGLWERIEAQAHAQLAQRNGHLREGVGVLDGRSRFRSSLRFAAAGLLGFLGFFAVQKTFVPDATRIGKASLTAGGPLIAEQIRDGIPLMGDSSDYVDSMQERHPWPEIALATSFATSESN